MKKPDAWLMLLNQDVGVKKPLLDRAHTVFWHWLAAPSLQTPYMRNVPLRPWANPQGLRMIQIIRDLKRRIAPYAMATWDERLYTAQPEWPEGFDSMRAFGLREPPSPYECACALLVEPHNKFWAFKNLPPLARSVTYWWLAGMPDEAILGHLRRRPKMKRLPHVDKFVYANNVLPTSSGIIDPTIIPKFLEDYFREAMKSKRFRVWALGSNPVPACANRLTARLIKEVLNGDEKKVRQSCRPEKRAWDDFLAHPYISSQFKTGHRRCPIERKVYHPEIVWKSVEDKLSWLHGEGEGQPHAWSNVNYFEQAIKRPPSWLRPLKKAKPKSLLYSTGKRDI